MNHDVNPSGSTYDKESRRESRSHIDAEGTTHPPSSMAVQRNYYDYEPAPSMYRNVSRGNASESTNLPIRYESYDRSIPNMVTSNAASGMKLPAARSSSYIVSQRNNHNSTAYPSINSILNPSLYSDSDRYNNDIK